MGVYFSVEQVEETTALGPAQIFCARLVWAEAALVDCTLVDLSNGREVASLANYPRWTESGLALFARLLCELGPTELDRPAKGRVTVSVQVGPRPSLVVERELGVIDLEGVHARVSMLSPFSMVDFRAVPVGQQQSVRALICDALRAALGWGAAIAPVPIALKDVPLRKRADGKHYVRIGDIPALPRRYVRQHFCLSRGELTIGAAQWQAFLQQLGANGPHI